MEPQLPVVAAAIALPFVVAAITPLLARFLGEAVGYVGAVAALVSFGLIGSQVGREGVVAVEWIPSMDVAVRFQVDGLALLFALLASGIGVLIFTYSGRYMHGESHLGRFYMALLAFMGSILGIAFAADLLVLFLFWELTSVTSFVLIGYHTDDNDSKYSARMAMVITVGGGLCLLVAIVLLAFVGSYDLSVLLTEPGMTADSLRADGLFVPVLVLLTIAAAAKSAQVPLYFWLPRAMVAPTPVSAFLHSATMVKVGVYALGRFRPIFVGGEWELLVATLGLVTMTVGAMLAVLASDIKELLAYSTASHLGLMVAGFGFQTHYGAEAGVFHLLNHALFKAALFLVAGIIAHEAGTRQIEDLGGLRHDLPVTAAITGVAALSMAGLPPFNGFYSKELLFKAAWETAQASGGFAWLYPATAVFGSIFTVLYSLRFLWLFLGDRPGALDVEHRPSLALVVPPAILATLAVVVSVRPSLALEFIVNDAGSATTLDPVDIHAIPTEISEPLLMSAVTVVAGVAAFPFYGKVAGVLAAVHHRTTVVHPSRVYNQTLTAVDRASDWTGAIVHNGLIRTYIAWILLAACGMTLLGYVTAAVGIPSLGVAETPLAMILVLAVAVAAAIAITATNSQTTGVLTLGILGFMIAIFFILASGPDLALTQLVVETLVLLVFLLVLEQMPTYYGELQRRVAARDAVVSLAVGATAFLMVLVAAPGSDAPLSETAAFYKDKAVPKGGGGNIVNVILTDFRAFDTLGESIVVLIAAVSVFVLLAMRSRGETR